MTRKSRPGPFVDPAELRSLTFGLSVEEISELCGVSACTVRRWLAEASPIPYAVAQLFRLRARGVVGPEWEDWRFGTDGLLYHPQWRRGFTGRDLAGMWWQCAQVDALEAKVRQLEAERRRLVDQVDELEALAAFYRRQVGLSSRLGLALQRIAG